MSEPGAVANRPSGGRKTSPSKPTYDLVIVGGGPAGAVAARKAALEGARVVVCDKARFPRDKPCGDGITPRATRLLNSMGLENELKRFHRVDMLRVYGAGRCWETQWPARDGFPAYGYVIARTDLDELLIREAEGVGAEVWEETTVLNPLVEDGVVRGVRVRSGTQERDVRAGVVIAADGASSTVCRALNMTPLDSHPVAVALRVQTESDRPEDSALEVSALTQQGRLVTGYGWVFPMGEGRVNVGVGAVTSFTRSRISIRNLMESYLQGLPASWRLPTFEDMQRAGQLKGWRLPMGLAVWPPWRPGMLAIGDAAGTIKPHTGAGISRAMHSGLMGAESALAALSGAGPEDLSGYQIRLEDEWGSYYRNGRRAVRLVSNPVVRKTMLVTGMWVLPLRSRLVKFILGAN